MPIRNGGKKVTSQIEIIGALLWPLSLANSLITVLSKSLGVHIKCDSLSVVIHGCGVSLQPMVENFHSKQNDANI